MTDDFTIYATGPCYSSVCTSMSDEEATARINRENPSGVGPWAIADEAFASGDANGRACDQMPETHRHLLFNC